MKYQTQPEIVLGHLLKEGIPELKIRYNKSRKLGQITNTETGAKLVRTLFQRTLLEVQEQFIVLYLDNSNNIIGFYRHSVGTLTATMVDVRIVLSVALKCASTAIILAHNHPSGSLTPSNGDIEITTKLREAARYMDIKVLDHFIITKESYYSFAENGQLMGITLGKPQGQFGLNKEIEQLIDRKDQSGFAYSQEELTLLQQYTGAGGYKNKTDKPDEGLLWEFYTPDSVVQAMWRLAYKYGFEGGKVLEPSCGTGRLLKYCAPTAQADGYEINYHSCRIAQLTYPQHTFYHKSFETLFFDGNRHLKDNHPKRGHYDLVIANPPYGIFSGKYAGMGEKKWTKATRYDHYFITRCLDLLKPGGLAVFLIQFSFLWSGSKAFDPVRHRISQQAELLDAYRLPDGTFQKSSYPPDLVVFRMSHQ